MHTVDVQLRNGLAQLSISSQLIILPTNKYSLYFSVFLMYKLAHILKVLSLRTHYIFKLEKVMALENMLWGQCYKAFFVRDLRIFVISQSVCPWQAFPAQSIVCGQGQEPTLEWSIRKVLQYGRQLFYQQTLN